MKGFFRHTTLLFLLLAGGLSLVLFSMKYQVQDLNGALRSYTRSIKADHEAIHVLRGEWALLNEPQRLRALAGRYLNLAPVASSQLTTFADLPQRPGGAGGKTSVAAGWPQDTPRDPPQDTSVAGVALNRVGVRQ